MSTSRFAIVVASALTLAASTATAQTRVFVAGSVFADVKRFSGDPSQDTLSANGVGGGPEVGLLVANRWSVRLALDAGDTTTRSIPIFIGVLTPPMNRPVTSYSERIATRLVATSALVGFHPDFGRRVHVGILGGMTFLHATRTFDVTPNPGVLAALVVRPHTIVETVAAPTVGVELPIDLTHGLAVAPELRATPFSLAEGVAGLALRPGVAIRWTF